MVFQDGHAYVSETGEFRVPVVFDNLIHKGEMPVTIGIFIDPGHLGSDSPGNRWQASNRSFEYDNSERPVRPLPAGGDPAGGRQAGTS